MNKTSGGVLYWTPRVLGILFPLFIGLFALDVFSEDNLAWEMVVGFLIHLIPAFIMLIVLAIAWRRETVGGLLYFVIYILFLIWFGGVGNWRTTLPLFSPLALIGALFIAGGLARQKRA